MSARLLTRAELEHVRSLPDLSAVFDYLLDTEYETTLKGEMLDVEDLAGFDAGITRAYSARVEHVRGIIEESAPHYVYFATGEWDLHHVRALARHLCAGAQTDDAERAHVPIGYFTRERYEAALRAESLSALVTYLQAGRRDLADALRTVIARSAPDDPSIRSVELALERFHYERLLERARDTRDAVDREVIATLTALFVDLANLRTALRFLGRRLPEDESEALYLPGGSLSAPGFLALMHADQAEHILDALPGGPLAEAIEKGMIYFAVDEKPSTFERLFDEQRIRVKRGLCLRYPVSLATPLYYLGLARNEMINLRMIARGVRYQLPAGTVQEKLVYA